ncbi:MAG: hypothetical protein AAGH57_07015 [Pseudomonadota bacterium]
MPPPFQPGPEEDEEKAPEQQAKARYAALNLMRLGGIAVTIAGLAGAREVIPLPYALSVVLALAGIVAFFFGPTWLVRRWKERDREG